MKARIVVTLRSLEQLDDRRIAGLSALIGQSLGVQPSLSPGGFYLVAHTITTNHVVLLTILEQFVSELARVEPTLLISFLSVWQPTPAL